ncbi:hypothetical protein WS90_07940 [Burkholderia cepacia]|uniref:Uncharacterized protein n=1 Tax=Burkholderia cepacia TaxID=292 RepID=A0A124SQ62_BURCE|nr:hypothetical protein [Burkholderia cepacia]KVK86192.1 hypothetical protein WS90_07940 [Burkholderia cepacia]
MAGSLPDDENPKTTHLTPYARGYEAYLNGLDRDDNPYEWLTGGWHDWMLGFAESESADRGLSAGEAYE